MRDYQVAVILTEDPTLSWKRIKDQLNNIGPSPEDKSKTTKGIIRQPGRIVVTPPIDQTSSFPVWAINGGSR